MLLGSAAQIVKGSIRVLADRQRVDHRALQWQLEARDGGAVSVVVIYLFVSFNLASITDRATG